MYNDVIIESYRDKKEDDIIFMKVIITFIQVLIITLLFSLCFLLFPFCIYWLNRRYQIEKKSKIENDKKEKEMIEWHKMDDWFEPSNKEEYKYPPVFIEINTDLPFHPDEKQIIYLETQYNVPLNSYISKEYETIKEFFKQCGYTFIYIPKFIDEIVKDGDGMIKYAYPQLSDSDILHQNGNFTRLMEDKIISNIREQMFVKDRLANSYIKKPLYLKGGFIRYYSKKEKDNCFVFSYYQFEKFEDDEIKNQIRSCSFPSHQKNEVLYSLGSYNSLKEYLPTYNADFSFSDDAQILIKDIKIQINKLRQTGISEMVIKSLFKFDDTKKLSKLLITNDYRIVLPDYNNMEITMTPLPKAVFLLYLKHPEGIMFKYLVDYRNELKDIYMQITNRLDFWKTQKSIDDIIDPTKNAINEKCSRIREAFIGKFDESLAQNYFITGVRLEPKRITLDRQLVVWETER